jgi:hypothetical protein
MNFDRRFVVSVIAVYLLPPAYLCLTGDTPEDTQAHPATEEPDPDTDGGTPMVSTPTRTLMAQTPTLMRTDNRRSPRASQGKSAS